MAMGRIVDLLSIKPRSTSGRRGLRKLSPDLITKARDETATQVTRIGLTFLGTAAFCLLSLLSPDSALLGCIAYARDCVRLAGPAESPELREKLLQMAPEWMAEAMHEER